MAAKTYKCVICGEQVSRRKSFKYMDTTDGTENRACRIHEEAQLKAQQLEEGRREEKKAEQDKLAQKKQKREQQRNETLDPCPRCYICGRKGMRQDAFYARWLIETTKYGIITGKQPNILDAKEMQKAVGALKGVRCLNFVRWTGDNKKRTVNYKNYQFFSQIEDLMGEAMLLVCQECCEKSGYETLSQEQMKKADNSFSDLVKKVAIYKTVGRPVIQSIAKQEMADNN